MDFSTLFSLWMQVLWACFITSLLATVAYEVTR